MASWDDVSAPVQQPTGWDAVSQSVPTPQIPDMSGVQKTAQQNLTQPVNDNAEGAKPEPPQSPSQRFDTALGMPVSATMNGNNQDTPLPSQMREHLVNAYKDGSAHSPSDFMQSALLSVAHIVAGAATPVDTVKDSFNIMEEGTEGAIRGGAQLETSIAAPFMSQESLNKLQAQGLYEPPSGNVALQAAHEYSSAVYGGVMSPIGKALETATNVVGSAATAAGVPQNIQSKIGSGFNTLMDFLGVAGIPDIAHAVPEGTGPWDRAPGADAMKQIVGQQLGKSPDAVTSSDIDGTIHKGFENVAPKASDFENTSTILSGDNSTVDSLHNVYKETGVRPDQVYADAKRDPEVMAAVQEGKIPAIYEHLIDKRPPIPDDVQAAMDRAKEWGPYENGERPSQLSKEGESASNNPFAKIFNPTGMSEASKDMATALRQGRGPENRDMAVIQDAMQKYSKDFAGMGDNARLSFIDYMEKRSQGATNPFPELQDAADKIRDIYAQMGGKIQKNFPDVGLRQDYFTHQYKDEAAAKQFFSDWVAKQGSERNLRARTFPTLSEAMEAGLEPKTTNPIETVMNYVSNMGRLVAAKRSVELAREAGIADFFKPGQEPEGWVPLGGNLGERAGKTLYAPEDAARVYNNDISEGATGEAKDILDNFQRLNNFTNKLVLGLSGYHFTATTMASMASDVGRALTGGTLGERAADIGKAVTAPVSNVITGQKYIDAYLGRSELSPELQKALDLAVKNNTINIKQQDYWKAGPAKDYVDVFKNGSAAAELKMAGEAIKEHPITGTVGVIANEVGRTMDTVAKPLFDYYIPRIKIAANINELHDWIQNHPEATPDMQDRAAQDIGNSIDNRFGEMMRDNLFWHAITKQTLQTVLLSYSWVTGAARMLKGIPDTANFIMKGQDLSSSARYLMGMAATYAAVNGVRTYIGTGHAPDNIMDFIYPRTGGTTPQGKEERELLPSHIGQYTNYLHEGIGELGNEMSPGLKLIYHLLENQDWRGLPITNDNNPWYSEQRWGDYAKYVVGEETPIGLKNFIQGDKKGSKISGIEKALGARQAPRFVTDPEGYENMMKHVNDAEYRKKTRSDERMRQQYENAE